MFLTESLKINSFCTDFQGFSEKKGTAYRTYTLYLRLPRNVGRRFLIRRNEMETRVALIGIVVENFNSAQEVNEILHNYGQYIIGRMGIPYQKRNVSIISVAVDAPADVISALSGKLGRLDGVSAKTVYSKLTENDNGQN